MWFRNKTASLRESVPKLYTTHTVVLIRKNILKQNKNKTNLSNLKESVFRFRSHPVKPFSLKGMTARIIELPPASSAAAIYGLCGEKNNSFNKFMQICLCWKIKSKSEDNRFNAGWTISLFTFHRLVQLLEIYDTTCCFCKIYSE